MTERTTILFCSDYGESGLRHFYPSAMVVGFANSTNPVLKVEVTELVEEVEDCYWAWWKNADQKFHHVYGAEFLVRMCFPNIQYVIDRGDGLLLPVSVEVLE